MAGIGPLQSRIAFVEGFKVRTRLIGASMLALLAAQARAQTTPGATSASATPKDNGAVEDIVVTATKRSERLQRVPVAVQVLDAKMLSQQNVNSFTDYLKLVPSLSTQYYGPNQNSIYLRGVSPGDNANHSGPLPTVGSYLDEAPVTTIGGALDIQPYDLARIEVLPGPQGTLYGASSEAGTVRYITNKPDPTHFSAGYSVEGNTVDHGGQGYVAEGFVNVPITDQMAVRIVGWDEREAGFIDNVLGTRTFPTSGATISNADLVKKNFNPTDTFGGRAALKIDLDENWTITPSIIAQDTRAPGSFGYEPAFGDLDVERFRPDSDHDRWAQAALTVNGKIGRMDLTYAFSGFVRDVHQRLDYSDYSIAYDDAYGSGNYWRDNDGNVLNAPVQHQDDKDHFNKYSNEIRLASPGTDRFRVLVGAFQEDQTHLIQQDYIIDGLGQQLSVPGWNQTVWLTKQRREDRDYAGFAELSYDVVPQFTVTLGVRAYAYSNTLFGFYGFGEGYNEETGYSSGEGVNDVNCLAGKSYSNAPCVNLDKKATGDGETHKVNFTYRIDADHMAYFTYSTGFRPGGINRSGDLPPYQADELTSFELGLKSQWLNRRLTINTALYDEDWNNFQFSFLGENSLTEIQNAVAANIKGFETSAIYRATDQLTLSGAITVQDPQVQQNLCGSDPNSGAPITGCADADAIVLHGAELPYTSRVKGSFTARDNFDITQNWLGHVQGTVSWQNSQEAALRVADKPTLGTIPGYTTLDLSAGAEHGSLQVEFFAKNVTDQRGQINRYVSCTVGVCGAPTTPDLFYVLPITPRTIGIRVSQKF